MSDERRGTSPMITFLQPIVVTILLLSGVMAIIYPSVLIGLCHGIEPLISWVMFIPGVEERATSLSVKYSMAKEIILLSWSGSIVMLVIAILSYLTLLTRFKEIRMVPNESILSILHLKVYRFIFFSWFDPSKFYIKENSTLKKMTCNPIFSERDREVKEINYKKSIFQLLSSALDEYVVRRQLIIIFILLLLVFLLTDSMSLGLIGRNAITFYLGYPIYIFILNIMIIELIIYLPIFTAFLISFIKRK